MAADDTLAALRDENERLKSGRFTKDEIHDICHNLHGTVSAQDFADGCAEEQRRLYGCSPDRDELAALRQQVAQQEEHLGNIWDALADYVARNGDDGIPEGATVAEGVKRLTAALAEAQEAERLLTLHVERADEAKRDAQAALGQATVALTAAREAQQQAELELLDAQDSLNVLLANCRMVHDLLGYAPGEPAGLSFYDAVRAKFALAEQKFAQAESTIKTLHRHKEEQEQRAINAEQALEAERTAHQRFRDEIGPMFVRDVARLCNLPDDAELQTIHDAIAEARATVQQLKAALIAAGFDIKQASPLQHHGPCAFWKNKPCDCPIAKIAALPEQTENRRRKRDDDIQAHLPA
jgi:hypothetical protein